MVTFQKSFMFVQEKLFIKVLDKIDTQRSTEVGHKFRGKFHDEDGVGLVGCSCEFGVFC